MTLVLVLVGLAVPFSIGAFLWQRWRARDERRRLLDLALATTFLRLVGGSADDGRERKYAAAVSNRLFANPSRLDDDEMFDPEEIEATAHAILEHDERVREVVVQSLRMMNRESGGRHPAIGEDVLHRFGDEYPESPDARSFQQLVASYAEEIDAAAGKVQAPPRPAPVESRTPVRQPPAQ